MTAASAQPAPNPPAVAVPLPTPTPPSATSPGLPPPATTTKTVADILADLHKRPSVTFSTYKGWTVAEDPENHALYSFAPPGSPAYPSVVRRTVSRFAGQIGVRTDGMCQAERTKCDAFMQDYSAEDEQLGLHMAKLRQSLTK